MRNRTKKEQKIIDQLAGLLVIIAGLVGWNTTKSLIGVVVAVGISLVAMVIIMTWRSARFRKMMQQSGIEEIDAMTGRQFEEYLGTLFGNQGYQISYTPTTGDFGADLILKKGQETIVVQAKRY